jgi:hypothetical protein
VAAEAQQVLPKKAQFLSVPLTEALRQYTSHLPAEKGER